MSDFENKLTKVLFEDKIKHLPRHIREEVLKEAPHTQILGDLPESLRFLGGSFVDLGFENLPLSKEEAAVIRNAFTREGVGMPGTGLKLRNHSSGKTLVEPYEGEPMLPPDWIEAVLVLDGDDVVYAGKYVRPDQL